MMQKMKRGDIYWVNFDPSIGTEIKKRRPAIVISNNLSNMYLGRVQVIPLTSNVSKVYKTELIIDLQGKKAKAIGSQITTIDKRRLCGFIKTISQKSLQAINEIIRIQLGLEI